MEKTDDVIFDVLANTTITNFRRKRIEITDLDRRFFMSRVGHYSLAICNVDQRLVYIVDCVLGAVSLS